MRSSNQKLTKLRIPTNASQQLQLGMLKYLDKLYICYDNMHSMHSFAL